MRIVTCKGNKRTCDITPMSETGINPDSESYTFPLGTEKKIQKKKRVYKRKIPIIKKKKIVSKKTKKSKPKVKKVKKKKSTLKKRTKK